MRIHLSVALLLITLVFVVVDAEAGPHDLASLVRGGGLSISGGINADGRFVAAKIELLDSPRRPKLRGTLESVDVVKRQLVLFGMDIEIDGETTMLGGGALDLDMLKAGQRIEIRCRVEDDGRWFVRSIEVDGIKASDKIKGTLTGMDFGNDEGDSLEIEGLRVWLSDGSRVVDGREADFAEELFDELKSEDGMLESGGEGLHIGDRVVLTGSLRQTTRFERDYQLGRVAEDELAETEPGLRLEAAGRWAPGVSTFLQLRAQRRYNLDSGQGRIGDDGEGQLQLRQGYAVWRDIGGSGLSTVVGKQRFRDEREFLFDEYLDAARVYLHRWRPLVLELSFMPSLVPLKEKQSSWDDLLLRAQILADGTRVSAFALRRWDSDDTRGREPLYLGLGLWHDGRGMASGWVEATLLRGQDKGRDLVSHALDLGLTLTARSLPWRPSATASLAIGSGDDAPNDGIDGSFHQTGYGDNSGRFAGLANFQYFGEVLDPELTNLRVLTLGISLRPHHDISLELVGHRYHQDEPDREFDDIDLLAGEDPLSGLDTEIGSELDLIVAWQGLWDRFNLSYAFGGFRPGSAFGPNAEPAYLHRIQFRVDL